MTGLIERKKALLERSAANREILLRESVNLRRAASYVDLGMDLAGKARAGLGVISALFACRTKEGQESAGWLGRLARGVGVATSVMGLWREWRGSRSDADAPRS